MQHNHQCCQISWGKQVPKKRPGDLTWIFIFIWQETWGQAWRSNYLEKQGQNNTSKQLRKTSLDSLRPSPHVPKWSLFSSVFLGIVSEIFASTEKDSTRCSSYSRPIGGAWNSPKTEKMRRSMRKKLARCKQTDSRLRNRTQEDNEVELLLWLALNYNTSKKGSISSAAQTQACSPLDVVIMRHRGVKRLKARGWGTGRWHHRYGKCADSLSTQKCKGRVFGFLHPETRIKNMLYRLHVDNRPKRCKTCAFTQKSISHSSKHIKKKKARAISGITTTK